MRWRVTATMLCATIVAGCQTWGLTWSEVTGVRYNRTIAERFPARIVAIGNNAITPYPIKVVPGQYDVHVESPPHGNFAGTTRTLPLNIEPCKRYYINAQFQDPVRPEWTPVIDEVESIAGCRVGA